VRDAVRPPPMLIARRRISRRQRPTTKPIGTISPARWHPAPQVPVAKGDVTWLPSSARGEFLRRAPAGLTFKPSILQSRPHFLIALRGPNHGPLYAARLIVGARNVEWQAMLIEPEALEFCIHRETREVECILQGSAFGN